MANIEFITEGIQKPQGKPRVYFTCHPADFNKAFKDSSQSCFEKICKDIFKIMDCAIYYTPDMSEPFDDGDVEKLGLMKLFVVPVTNSLLTSPNRTMKVDIPFAKEHNIRVLPIIMEPIPSSLYSDEKNFGKYQYINPFSTDFTEVSYYQKLTRYIKETLVDQAMSKKIKDAFDSYIFLSYRKMDRKLAKELMEKIHSIEGYYDIAIWYDEFLVPGEQWDENIKSAMNMVKDKSNLFILLVTPHITEKVVRNGKECDNYVVDKEYPKAKKISMNILPAEIENIDYRELKVFRDIPKCVNVHTDDFVAVMKEILQSIENKNNDEDPEHLYYIGLAYLNGIDIEVDTLRGIKLLTLAAEGNNYNAIEKLIHVYRYGDGVNQNSEESLRWAKRLVELYEKSCEEDDEKLIDAREILADVYYERGEIVQALCIYESLLEITINRPNTIQDRKTLSIYGKLAAACSALGDYQKAKGMFWMVYSMPHMTQQEETPETIDAFFEYAKAHLETEHFREAYKYLYIAYGMYVDAYTENDYRTLLVKEQFALAHCCVGLYSEAIEMQEGICHKLCEKYGKDNPVTIKAYMNLYRLHSSCGNHGEAIGSITDLYNTTCNLFGNGNPLSLECLALLAEFCRSAGNFDDAILHYERLYTLQQKYLGSKHINTLQERNNLGITYVMMGGEDNIRRAMGIFSQVLELEKSALGVFELKTLMTMYLIANCYSLLGNNAKAIELQKEVVDLMHRHYKDNHINTMRYEHFLGCYYYLRYWEMLNSVNGYQKEEMLQTLLWAELHMKKAYAIGIRIYAENDQKNKHIMGDIEIVQNEKKRLCQ